MPTSQIPKRPIVLIMHDVRQLVTQRLSHRLVIPPPVIPVRAQPDLDHSPAVPVQSERLAPVGRSVPQRLHLRQQRHGPLALAHRGADAPVRAQALEEGEGRGGIGQVWESVECGEGVLVFDGPLAGGRLCGLEWGRHWISWFWVPGIRFFFFFLSFKPGDGRGRMEGWRDGGL